MHAQIPIRQCFHNEQIQKYHRKVDSLYHRRCVQQSFRALVQERVCECPRRDPLDIPRDRRSLRFCRHLLTNPLHHDHSDYRRCYNAPMRDWHGGHDSSMLSLANNAELTTLYCLVLVANRRPLLREYNIKEHTHTNKRMNNSASKNKTTAYNCKIPGTVVWPNHGAFLLPLTLHPSCSTWTASPSHPLPKTKTITTKILFVSDRDNKNKKQQTLTSPNSSIMYFWDSKMVLMGS